MTGRSATTVTGNYLVIYARFHLKPGMRARYLSILEVVLQGIRAEPLCKSILVHEDLQNPDLVILYEIWAGTREAFDRDERNKPYRAEYARILPDLLIKPVEVDWLLPTAEWYSDIIGKDRPNAG